MRNKLFLRIKRKKRTLNRKWRVRGERKSLHFGLYSSRLIVFHFSIDFSKESKEFNE